jgi:hypothetical protein
METPTLAPAVRAGLERLIDYAGLFPPAQLPIEAAVSGYEQARASGASWMLGRFIVRAGDLEPLRATLAGKHRELSVIAAPEAFAAAAAARGEGWAAVGALEVPLGDATIDACARALEQHGLADLPVFVELRQGDIAMEELARHGLGAKLRCGGVDTSAYPSVEWVATFIDMAVRRGVPFKATAGLHHPVRHFNAEAGVTMHGFLNVLIASARAGAVDRAALENIIAEEDPSKLSLEDEPSLARARHERFLSYGSCSFDEPVDDLRALGLLPA